MLKINKTTPKTKDTKKKDSPVDKAKAAVKQFEKLRAELTEKQQSFEEEYPEANAALNEIKETEDACRAAIEKAKPLVREAGQTIGDFIYTPKSTSSGYLGDKLLEVLCGLDSESLGDTLKELYKTGMITALAVDKDVARVVKAAQPDVAELLEPAWDEGGAPLTAAITTPKL
jgi:hypothetical protein